MTFLVLALVLGAEAAPAERLLSSQVGAALGVAGAGYAVKGSRWGDALVAPAVSARGVFSGFLVEGLVQGALPMASGGAATAVSLAGRVGWVGERFSVHAGAVMNWAQDAKPALSTLPSLRAELSFGAAGVSLGVLDFAGQVPLHLSAEVTTRLGHFSLGYVVPLGVVATVDVPLTGPLGLRGQAWAYRLFTAETALLTVGLTWGGAR